MTKKHDVVAKGIGVSPIKAYGRVKIIHNIADLSNIEKKDIIVVDQPTLAMVSAIKRANGIITNKGSVNCRLAIILRELDIPCIVGTQNATEILTENDIISMDGTKGLIFEEGLL
jgi:pyruvate,water dikinase